MLMEIVLDSRKLGSLGEIAPVAAANSPRVSIIVPACNEAKTIAQK
jgi:hypothetical protein